MANDEVNELRALARKRRTAVTKKISRLHTHNDVELSGTKYDPRGDLAKLKRYNAPQLRAYIARQDAFTGRQTQYLRGARGSVVSKQAWDKFQTAQRLVSARNKTEFDKISGILIPRFNQTIGERIAMLAKSSRMGSNLAANRPFDEIARSARGLMGDKGAKKQAEMMLKRLERGYLPNRISNDRENFNKMMDVINNPGLRDAVNKLNDRQFNVLFNYTGFANETSQYYENAKHMISGRDDAFLNSTNRDINEESNALIAWIKTLDLRS